MYVDILKLPHEQNQYESIFPVRAVHLSDSNSCSYLVCVHVTMC